MKNHVEIQVRVPNQTRYLSLIGRIGELVAQELDRFPGDREALGHHLNVVLTEAMANAIRHANQDDPDKEVYVSISISQAELVICVYDSGRGFDLDAVPTPCFAADQVDEKGRGLFIIRSLMDSVVYRNANGGYVLEMKKTLS